MLQTVINNKNKQKERLSTISLVIFNVLYELIKVVSMATQHSKVSQAALPL